MARCCALVLVALLVTGCTPFRREAWSSDDRFRAVYQQGGACTLIVLHDRVSGACFLVYRCGRQFSLIEVSRAVCQ